MILISRLIFHNICCISKFHLDCWTFLRNKYLRILSIFFLHFVKNKDFCYFFLWAMHWLFSEIRTRKKILFIIIIENIKIEKSCNFISIYITITIIIILIELYIDRWVFIAMVLIEDVYTARKLHFSLISSPVLFRNRWWFDLTHRHVLSDDFCWLQYCSKLFINSIVLP